MTDFIINDHIMHKEAASLAREIFDEAIADMGDDETPELYRDDMSDRARETADGHGWVIYTHKALMICAHCNTAAGEEFLEDTGMPETPTFDGLATIIAFGTLRAEIESELDALVAEWEDAQDA